MKNRKHRSWSDAEIEHLRINPGETRGYLEVAFEEAEKDGNWGAFLAALRTVAEAKGGMGSLAKRLRCSRPSLYRTLSSEGNPRLQTLGAILAELGIRMSFHQVENKPSKARRSGTKRHAAATR